MTGIRSHVVLLVGGIGGAKLALGLADVLPPDALTIVVNTGDDFEHLGLHISPDVDTVMYTLAGLVNPHTGWGVDGDSFRMMEMIDIYGGPTWFGLGDKDLATHLMRTSLLRAGHTLTQVTEQLSKAAGVRHRMLPMSDDPVRTMVETEQGILGFQEYFVRENWQPVVKAIHFEGSDRAQPSPPVAKALDEASLIVIAPSNPYLSIDPLLSIQGIRQQLENSSTPRVAVSPVIGGKAVKGPTVKLMGELGVENSSVEVARHYRNIIDGIILDITDSTLCEDVTAETGIQATARQTYMTTRDDKVKLAQTLLDWAEEDLL